MTVYPNTTTTPTIIATMIVVEADLDPILLVLGGFCVP